jgi:serine/threonine-protein kinase
VPSVRDRRPNVSERLDAAIQRAMAKDPRDRFPTMDVFAAELRGCLGETALDGTSPGDETVVIEPRPAQPPRPAAARARERPSVWPLILLLAGLAVLAGIFAAVFAFTGSPEPISNIVHKVSGGGSKPVRLAGITAYDPQGDNREEHNSEAPEATDHDQSSYWTTEHYEGGLQKSGVGLVLDAGRARKLSKIVVRSDTPGFTAEIEAGNSPSGGFRPVSGPQPVARRTTFSLKDANARYYVVWITDLGPNSFVHVNEVTAKSG